MASKFSKFIVNGLITGTLIGASMGGNYGCADSYISSEDNPVVTYIKKENLPLWATQAGRTEIKGTLEGIALGGILGVLTGSLLYAGSFIRRKKNDANTA